VAFQAQIPDGTVEEVLFLRLMGGMAFDTGTDGNGAVHELLLEGGTVMTPETEICPVLAGVQQKPSRGPVRLVAAKTVTIPYRRVHDLLLPEGVVALIAQDRHLGCQLPTLFTQ
jgi:hypothetical protein